MCFGGRSRGVGVAFDDRIDYFLVLGSHALGVGISPRQQPEYAAQLPLEANLFPGQAGGVGAHRQVDVKPRISPSTFGR